MGYDGFLGYIDTNDPVSDDDKSCIDRFLILPKAEQNIYFAMYDKNMDYCEKTDEFGKIIPYTLEDWIKTALKHIKGFDNEDCTNYALRKSLDNIKSTKIIKEKDYNEPITIEDLKEIEDIAKEQCDTYKKALEKINNNSDSITVEILKKGISKNQQEVHESVLKELSNHPAPIPNVVIDTISTFSSYNDKDTYISWDEFFMGVAELAAKRSKDPSTKVGAVIVKNNHIISTGYNGMPNTISNIDNDYIYPGGRDEDMSKCQYSYVVHAEENAILSSPIPVRDSILYCTLFPCNECAKAIVQSGIKEVVYKDKRNEVMYDVSTTIMQNAGIKLRRY